MTKAIFSRPVSATSAGGAHICVNVVTLHKGKVILFEKPGLPGGQELGDLWFPWDYLEYGEAPTDAAKRVLKQWGKAEPKEIELIEVFSMVPPGEDWQLSFQYVAELKSPARNGDHVKNIKSIEKAQLPRMVGELRRSDVKRYLDASRLK
jgi:ADP-ribose pyrophosphatase YjhB (NUDIX family)